MNPTKIKLNKQESLTITWDNGKEYTYPLKFLRDESPDAQNKGETILWKHYEPPPKGPDKPGKHEIENIEMVGSYAINIKWRDGYDYGIYSFDLLARLGEYLNVKNKLPKDFHNHNGEDKH
ncbi:MAG: hypothetical protein A2V66_03190 [Ignavibacteria bacterium RBG_13_36_8]|nr:MAG: hypothetical protein A2V66_03190 [Ignavibacteria bacterium RBG_13_36_8]